MYKTYKNSEKDPMGSVMRCPYVYKTVTCSPMETTLLGPGEEKSVPVRFSDRIRVGQWVSDEYKSEFAGLLWTGAGEPILCLSTSGRESLPWRRTLLPVPPHFLYRPFRFVHWARAAATRLALSGSLMQVSASDSSELIRSVLDDCVRKEAGDALIGSRIRAVMNQCGDLDLGDVVEAASRRLLSQALEQHDEAYAARLVGVCVAYALWEIDHNGQDGTSLGAVLCVPFKLLEDALDASSTSGCEFWWAHVEQSCEALTHATLFQRGKFVLLRLCNSLLRRLSRTRHAELCGRVRISLSLP